MVVVKVDIKSFPNSNQEDNPFTNHLSTSLRHTHAINSHIALDYKHMDPHIAVRKNRAVVGFHSDQGLSY